jgi:hypothetical protein
MAPAIPKQPVEANFDFEQFLKKFDKAKFLEDIESDIAKNREEGKITDADLPSESAYVKDDFWDNLSGQASDVDGESAGSKGSHGMRLVQEQRKRDSETFGVSAVRNQQYGAHTGGQYYGSQPSRGGHYGSRGGQHNQGSHPSSQSGSSQGTRGGHRGGHSGGIVGGQRVNTNQPRQQYHNNTNRAHTHINQPRGGANNRGGRGGNRGGQGTFRPKAPAQRS